MTIGTKNDMKLTYSTLHFTENNFISIPFYYKYYS